MGKILAGEKQSKGPSDLERAFETHWTQLAPKWIKPYETQYRFSRRLWRFDAAWPMYRVAVELDGGVFSNGRHVRGTGYTNDCVKLNAAAVEGWTVLRFTSAMLDNDPQGCINQIVKLIKRSDDEYADASHGM